MRGIIHAGMMLKVCDLKLGIFILALSRQYRDHPLEQMTFDDYMAAIKPKVHGTRNLDDSFSSQSLDFFYHAFVHNVYSG